jgi:hypothetical protein
MEAIELADKLRTVCHKTDEFAVYEFGWDDAKLANNLGISISNVQNMRIRLLGKTKKETVGATTNTNLARRLDLLEAWARRRPVDPFRGEN